VRGYDPAVPTLPAELNTVVELASSPLDALNGSHLAVVSTEWPMFRSLRAADINAHMQQPLVIDPNHFLADVLGDDPHIRYFATGKRAA
jgi:hypothetical protein